MNVGPFVPSANSDSMVEPLEPPLSCQPGDRVFVEGYEHEKAGGKDTRLAVSLAYTNVDENTLYNAI